MTVISIPREDGHTDLACEPSNLQPDMRNQHVRT